MWMRCKQPNRSMVPSPSCSGGGRPLIFFPLSLPLTLFGASPSTTTLNLSSPSPRQWSPALEDDRTLLVVVSTTGNGDPPDNCDALVRHLKKAKGEAKGEGDEPAERSADGPLRRLSYATLALGDTNYDKFCETGKVSARDGTF